MINRRGEFPQRLIIGRGQLQRHFGSDQSVWRDGDWNGFVRIALAGLLVTLIELAESVMSTNWHGVPDALRQSAASSLVMDSAT